MIFISAWRIDVASRSARWRVVCLVILLAVGAVERVAPSAQQPRRAAQDEFVPIDQLPPDEKLPAARLLIAAYSVAWVLVAGYLWSIWRRLGRVEHEIAEVSRRMQSGAVAPKPPGGGGTS